MIDDIKGHEVALQVAAREADILGKPPRIAPLPEDEVRFEAHASWTELRSNYAGMPVEPGPIENTPKIFFTMLRREELWRAVSNMTIALTGKAALPVRLRELVILRTGWLCQAPFEWGEHVKKAKDAGISTAEIQQLIVGSTAPGWNDLERALLSAVEQLHESAMIDDATWHVLEQTLSPEELIELPILVGQFTTVGYFQNALRLPLGVNNDGLAAR
jgi:alkylhydroperoxidase family enzyme